MLLKSKICFTVFVVYEAVVISLLHFPRTCDAIFSSGFCAGWFRYFLFCIIIPLFVGLILMWIHEIVRAHRRRRFIRRAKNTVNGILAGIRGHVSEHMDVADIEKIITAAVLIGIKKYADKHPNLRHNINNVMDLAHGDIELDVISTSAPVKTKKSVPLTRSNTSRKVKITKKK